MNWFFLVIAGLFEIGFTSCLVKANQTNGTGSILWAMGFIVCLCLSMLLLFKASQSIPMSMAYAVWTGIGAIGTVVIGILAFKEPYGFLKMFFLTTAILSLIGLKVVSD